MTICRIKKINNDSGSIEIEQTDAFQGTPVIGISPYIPENDRVETCTLPKWLRHWPEWITQETESIAVEGMKDAEISSLEWFSDEEANESETFGQSGKLKPVENPDPEYITVLGARQNNLKDITVSIPKNKLTVITGLSGSGKSSLAFDTLYAEGQRRYMQSLSASSRRAVGVLEKADFDHIYNILPAVAIEQKNLTNNPRSTVGSLTDIYTYLRILYARWGQRHCTKCGTALSPQTPKMLTEKICKMRPGTETAVFAGKSADEKYLITSFSIPEQESGMKKFRLQCLSSLSEAFKNASGFLTLLINNETIIRVTDKTACTECGAVYFKASPSLFSYNSPAGMCPTCNGMGIRMEVDPEKVISNPDRSLLDEASPWYGNLRKHREKPNANWFRNEVLALAENMKVDLEIPWKDLPEDFREKALHGTGTAEYSYTYNSGKTGRAGTITRPVGGAVNHIERLFKQSKASNSHEVYKHFLKNSPCRDCGGERLAAEGRMVMMGGKRYPEAAAMSLKEFHDWLPVLISGLPDSAKRTAAQLILEIQNRAKSLNALGLNYLGLDRSAASLSGGESQRIKLTGQMGSGLSGILYVLDEPSIGLHKRDHGRIIEAMKNLRNEGNTVVVVEHDPDTMTAADKIIDMGPGAGIHGGEICAEGTPREIMNNPESITGPVLKDQNKKSILNNLPDEQYPDFLTIRGAVLNNLKSVTASFPLGKISCVTGVSGSGKSSLIRGTLVPALIQNLHNIDSKSGDYISLENAERLSNIIHVDQSAIGKSPRSIPATYIGFYDEIRNIFAATKAAKIKKLKAGHFSFNDKKGRCPTCEGLGKLKIELQFLPDAWTTCHDCEGKRYSPEILDIRYKDKTISDVLNMDVNEAEKMFQGHPKITDSLKLMRDVGLEYLKIGQSSATLSGGEAQRIKLAKQLILEESGNTLYVLDEPTSGLHIHDIKRLLEILHRLSEKGNTIIIIEHNTEVISSCHWIVDLGPSGGNKGGYIQHQGSLKELLKKKNNATSQAFI